MPYENEWAAAMDPQASAVDVPAVEALVGEVPAVDVQEGPAEDDRADRVSRVASAISHQQS